MEIKKAKIISEGERNIILLIANHLINPLMTHDVIVHHGVVKGELSSIHIWWVPAVTSWFIKGLMRWFTMNTMHAEYSLQKYFQSWPFNYLNAAINETAASKQQEGGVAPPSAARSAPW